MFSGNSSPRRLYSFCKVYKPSRRNHAALMIYKLWQYPHCQSLSSRRRRWHKGFVGKKEKQPASDNEPAGFLYRLEPTACTVLDYKQTVLFRNSVDRIHVCALTVYMYGQYCFSLFCNPFFYLACVNAICFLINIDNTGVAPTTAIDSAVA